MPVDYLMHWNKRHLIPFRVIVSGDEIICVSAVSVDRFLAISGSVMHINRRCPEGTKAPHRYMKQRDRSVKSGMPNKMFIKVLTDWIESKISASQPTTHYGNDKLQLALFWSPQEYFALRDYLTPELFDHYFERVTILSSVFFTRQDADIFLNASCSNLKQSMTNCATYLELPRQGYDPLYECQLMREIFLGFLLSDLGAKH